MMSKAIDLSHPMVGQCRIGGARPIARSQSQVGTQIQKYGFLQDFSNIMYCFRMAD